MSLAEGKPKLLRIKSVSSFQKQLFSLLLDQTGVLLESECNYREEFQHLCRSPAFCWKTSSSGRTGNDEGAAFYQSVFFTSTDAPLHHCMNNFSPCALKSPCLGVAWWPCWAQCGTQGVPLLSSLSTDSHILSSAQPSVSLELNYE